jgi:hypothetical protein
MQPKRSQEENGQMAEATLMKPEPVTAVFHIQKNPTS